MNKKVLIIAEAGVNHNGSFEMALQLIDSAVLAQVDVVKFQTFRSGQLVTHTAPKADYQIQSDQSSSSQLEMLKRLELPLEAFVELSKYASQKEIEFLTTAFDLESLEFLRKLNLKRMKVPSGEITNYPYLRSVASFRLPTILSTGMASLGEIEDAVKTLLRFGLERNQITILHCNTEYPTPMGDVNLLAMKSIQSAFQTEIGYSDHTAGIEVSIAAVALGASVIEKHFTLSQDLDGPDHKASLEPAELKLMVQGIRNIELALGNGIKSPTPSELKNKIPARKSIVAARNIAKGSVLSEDCLTTKRPGSGVSPMNWETIIGQTALRDYKVDDLL